MLKKISPTNNVLNWFELPVSDMIRAKKFYETILSIKLVTQKAETTGEEMTLFPRLPKGSMGLSGVLSGALIKGKRLKPSKDGVLIYLNASPSIQKVIDKVEDAGGKITVPKTKNPAGFIAVIIDTEGNQVGLHAAK